VERVQRANGLEWGVRESFPQVLRTLECRVEELFFGQRYRAIEKIGTGGMADVYKAVDESLGRTVAVKVMHARYAADPSFAARFRQEARAAANLVSPNIVNIYDWGQDADTYYIVMELVHGSDLKSIIEAKGALPSRTVADIGAQVCCALSVAHGYDVIHRDIKPHNIMVQPDGAVKVMDFGIARAGDSMMTQTGSVLGTAHYLSPEQAQGTPLTGASDLYSLGVVLYEAATGRLPFHADTPVAVAFKQVNEQAAAPHLVNPDIDPGLEAVILKAMAKPTADRYASADDLRRDLRAVAEGRPIHAPAALTGVLAGGASAGATSHVSATAVMPPVTEPEVRRERGRRPRTAARRRPLWPWVAVAVLLAAIGIGIALNANGASANRDAPAPAPRVVRSAVPDVRSMTLAAAQAALKVAGFKVGGVTEAFSATVGTSTVVSQSTKPNATAVRGSAVDLVISKGREMAAVPVVDGMLEADAFKALQAAGFSPQALPSQFNADVAANTVYEQTPAAKALAAKGSIVTYVVSRGPEPVPVPDLSGWTGTWGKSKDGRGHR
jgi:eukaryotic-like serine/threonine-protein kinase